VTLFVVVLVLMVAFLLYMGLFENVRISTVLPDHRYHSSHELTDVLIQDSTAPAGVRREITWALHSEDAAEGCLCFYVIHQRVRVYYDGMLVYTMGGADTNRLGLTTGTNWCSVPIGNENMGKTVKVELTPLFKSVVDTPVEFLVGSHYSIFLDQLLKDMPALFMTTLCAMLGILIIAVYFYFTLVLKTRSWTTLSLGVFSVIIGISRFTDIKSVPMLLSKNVMVLNYISIGTLFLSSMAMLLFVSSMFREKRAKPLRVLSCACSLLTLVALALQCFGVAELKQTLFLCHAMLILTLCATTAAFFVARVQTGKWNKNWKYFLILVVGSSLDLLMFYTSQESSNLVFSVGAFIIYALLTFMSNVLGTNRKAFTDSRTGLANKARWMEVTQEMVEVPTGTAFMMLDLNGLKHVNDTQGHEAGDELIFNFSNILRNTMPKDSLICRWGGDEFTVLLSRTAADSADALVEKLRDAVEQYNQTAGELTISFAVGYALADAYPGLGHKELLAIADSQMYLDKRAYRATAV
jgi:diguanylate cyclase (GGDEF)-like protein